MAGTLKFQDIITLFPCAGLRCTQLYNVQFMLSITHGEQSADGWKNTGEEKPTNGDEEISMTRAESSHS